MQTAEIGRLQSRPTYGFVHNSWQASRKPLARTLSASTTICARRSSAASFRLASGCAPRRSQNGSEPRAHRYVKRSYCSKVTGSSRSNRAVAPSFNMLSVDTDTSTSDTCAILANGLAGAVDEAAFLEVLTAGCTKMTEILARDGDGAEHLVRVSVRGALNDAEAHVVAKSILNSPLVKTMVHGADPNVGRLLMAIGKCFDCTIRPATTDAWINGFQVVGHGERLAFDDAVVRETLSREVVDLSVSLGVGDGEAVAYGCDLTKGYVDENASYYSS